MWVDQIFSGQRNYSELLNTLKPLIVSENSNFKHDVA